MESVDKNEEITPSYENQLINTIEWSTEGPGQHNFIRITTEHLPGHLEQKLKDNGYEVKYFVDPNNEVELSELENLLIDAQSYMRYMDRKKIALVVSINVYHALKSNPASVGNWSLNSMYLSSFSDIDKE